MSVSRQRRDEPVGAPTEEHLRALEAALERAIERSRQAKRVAKQAKDEAKLAKKDKKRARQALIQAQEEFGLHLAADGATTGPSNADDN